MMPQQNDDDKPTRTFYADVEESDASDSDNHSEDVDMEEEDEEEDVEVVAQQPPAKKRKANPGKTPAAKAKKPRAKPDAKPRAKYDGPYRCAKTVKDLAPVVCDFCSDKITETDFWRDIAFSLMRGFYLPIERPKTDARAKLHYLFQGVDGIDTMLRNGVTNLKEFTPGLQAEFGISPEKTILQKLYDAGKKTADAASATKTD